MHTVTAPGARVHLAFRAFDAFEFCRATTQFPDTDLADEDGAMSLTAVKWIGRVSVYQHFGVVFGLVVVHCCVIVDCFEWNAPLAAGIWIHSFRG